MSGNGEEYEEFNENFLSLCQVSIDILADKKEINTMNREYKKVFDLYNIYYQEYTNTKREEIGDFHVELFVLLFGKYKKHILSLFKSEKDDVVDDDWLKNGNIYISLGENMGEDFGIKYPISLLYKYACDIYEHHKEIEKKYPQNYENENDKNVFYYKEYFILFLYKIFSNLPKLNEKDKDILDNFVSRLENLIPDEDEEENDGSLSKMLNSDYWRKGSEQIGDAIKVLRDKLPDQYKNNVPDGDVIQNAFQNVMSNDKVIKALGNAQSTLGEIFAESSGDFNIATLTAKAYEKLATPEYFEAFGEVIEHIRPLAETNTLGETNTLAETNTPGETNTLVDEIPFE
jgi:hypothetical protein